MNCTNINIFFLSVHSSWLKVQFNQNLSLHMSFGNRGKSETVMRFSHSTSSSRSAALKQIHNHLWHTGLLDNNFTQWKADNKPYKSSNTNLKLASADPFISKLGIVNVNYGIVGIFSIMDLLKHLDFLDLQTYKHVRIILFSVFDIILFVGMS